MPMTATTSGIDAFLRLVRTDGEAMPAALAKHLLKLDFSAADQRRMSSLSRRNSEGLLSHSQAEQLMGYVRCGHLLAAMQSQARQALRRPAPAKLDE